MLFVRGREGRGGAGECEGGGGEGRASAGAEVQGGGGCHPALLAEGEPGLDLPDPPAAAAVTWRADMD